MSAKLFCKYGPMRGLSIVLGEETTIGRAAGCALVVAHKLVSGTHARIRRDPDRGCYVLEDLGSTNGTLLDGTPVEEPERLGHLHVISFGGSSDFFFLDTRQIPRESGSAPTPPQPSASAVSPEAAPEADPKHMTFHGKAFVPIPDILAGDGARAGGPASARETFSGKAAPVPQALARMLAGERPEEPAPLQPYLAVAGLAADPVYYPLEDGKNIVGRSHDLAIRIDHEQISRTHAVFRVHEGTISLRDLGSTNGTFLDDEPVTGEITLVPGARVRFGSIKSKIVLR